MNIIDHKDKLELQLWYYNQSEKIKQFTAAFLDEVTLLEKDTYDISLTADLTTTTGSHLDRIGLLVEEFREGRDDEDFRNAINLRIAINSSNGTIEDIINIINILLGEDTELLLTRTGKAVVSLYIQHPNIPPDLVEFLGGIMPTGVKIGRLMYSELGTPWIPTEKGSSNFVSAILPERGDLSSTVRIPPEIL